MLIPPYRTRTLDALKASSPRVSPLVTSVPVVATVPTPRRAWKKTISSTLKLLALAMVAIVMTVPAIAAFEAHIINVTAEIRELDPPILTPPGSSTSLDNIVGGVDLIGELDVVMSDDDAYVTHIYYTFGAGSNPLIVPDPVCGQTGPDGGGGDKNDPQHLLVTDTTFIKAIGCDGTDSSAHVSIINLKIYFFAEPLPQPLLLRLAAPLTGAPDDGETEEFQADVQTQEEALDETEEVAPESTETDIESDASTTDEEVLPPPPPAPEPEVPEVIEPPVVEPTPAPERDTTVVDPVLPSDPPTPSE